MNKEVTSIKSSLVFTAVSSAFQLNNLKIMLRSLRSFGGEISQIPVIIFSSENSWLNEISEEFTSVELFNMEKDDFKFYFQLKVKAAAQSEKLYKEEAASLIWLSPNCLIIKPPRHFILDNQFHAAFRPVHIKNIGLSPSLPVDGFWNEIYRRVGISEIGYEVTSLLGNENLRPYFNTHCFSINSELGILNKWEEIYAELIDDNLFIDNYCNDQQHQIFLHQAILSALITKYIPRENLRILDTGYSYPLHFHSQLQDQCLFKSLEQITCPVYEGSFSYPGSLSDLYVDERLDKWFRIKST